MKTVILCGGLGTRLKEETEFKPKPMVTIGSQPILWHIMKIYAHYGHTNFILPLGYKGEMIKNYFYHYEMINNDITVELGRLGKHRIHQKHEEYGWNITLSDTGEKTLKGARIKKIEKYIDDETFMMTYGDGTADININKLIAFHKSHGKMITLSGINPASRFGRLTVDGNNVKNFNEKPKTDFGFINIGFFVLNRAIFDYLSEDDSCDFEIKTLEQIANNDELMLYRHDGFWACMDTIRDREYLNKLWAEGNAKWKVW